MEYLLSILVMAAILAVWGIAYSRWGKGRGGCGSCSALDNRKTPGTCCMDRDAPCDDHAETPKD